MSMTYSMFLESLTDNPNHKLVFYLPDGKHIPKHFHVTDIGSVFKYMMDCGGEIREETTVQLQLWLGKDIWHRLRGETLAKIAAQSSLVLGKLPDLQNTKVMIEFKNVETVSYVISHLEMTDTEIVFYLQSVQTQCLAWERVKQKKISSLKSCCGIGCCS